MVNACIYCLAVEGEAQRLADLAQHHGWIAAQTLIEHPSTAPDRRAGLATIRRMVAAGAVQGVIVPSLTMLGASLDEMVALIAKMAGGNVDLISETEGIDTTTPQGAGWMTAVASLHGYKEAIRKQAARAGQLRAHAAGVPCGRPKLPFQTIEKARKLLASGMGTRESARRLGISAARVHAERRLMEAERTSRPFCHEG